MDEVFGPCIAFVGMCLYVSRLEQIAKTSRVTVGVDTIMTYPYYGDAVNAVLAAIQQHVKTDQTFLVIPEGAMLNFLARRTCPSPYLNFNPTEVHLYGEDRMFESLEREPPNFVILAPKQMHDFGVKGLGVDYGNRISAWLSEHYRVVGRLPPENYPMVISQHED